ncbi:MAG: TetR/AcrR family transcriptional regulator [Sporichthyaceae bacterium]
MSRAPQVPESALDPAAPPAQGDRRLERGRSTRAQLLAAAIEVLREQGYIAASMRAVSDRAGTPLSLVQYHFGSKQGLLIAVMDEMNTRGLERQRAMWDDGRPFAEQWRTACDYLHEDVSSGYVRILWELWAAGLADPELAERWVAAMRGWRELIVDRLDRWQVEDKVALPMSSRALATLIANAFQGAETEILAGFTEDEAPHLEALEACAAIIEGATRPGRPKKRRQ